MPVLDRGPDGCARAEGAALGGCVLRDAADGEQPQVLLMATGSEVHLALAAQVLADREEFLPPALTARVSVEAGVALGRRQGVGPRGRIVSLDHFGASADHQRLYAELGLTAEAVAAARESLAGTG
ncbi:hypothetical protein GCM10018781_72620 [Kitasatospora indigofera]|uniref:Transketolase-like C-terminal domain-containing protein n=1 Tax=Kitasatospora indigofera TaxID=67307 RepID=A0A919L5D1_9ACTN|nr:hypothetical protein [Kitasatospora indigofera]GHH84054.1 hypothetical protein GCM10018781_72620 [Kitasatospora indigofera]